MSDNKFIERLKGKDTSKSILEINNEAAKTSFANMPSGTSNAIDVYSDHRADATAVLNGTTNWKISNSNLILANDVTGDGADFSSTYSVSGAGLWIDSVYTFPSTGDPAHPVAMVFNPSTKWVLKVCGDNLIVDGGYIADFTLLVKIGTSNVFTKTFSVAEQAGQFCKEFVLDFNETNAGIIKASGLSTLTVQLLCGTANASARIYNGMTILTCLQRKVDASAVSNLTANVDDLLNAEMIPVEYFSNAEFIDQIEDGEQAYAVFERDGDNVNLAGWTPKDAVAYKDEVIIKAEVMPTPNADLIGAIYQYTGVTSAPYEHGYIYECKETSPGVYGWERIDVQPGGSRGRFLALWNCATGLAESNPPYSPYEYKTGDYFIVDTVSSATPAVNYKPDGSSYTTGVASTTVETNEVSVNDTYFYDGTVWKLQSNAQKEVSFSALAGSPYDNTNLSNALNAKQDNISDLATIRSGAALGATAVQPGDLATVATTGDYDDLLNKPTIPTVNNARLTIQKNGTKVATFTANASSNVTANISVPTTTNDLTNNSGFITSSDIPVTDVTVGGTSVVSAGVAVVPAIPTVNNSTITITQGGVTKGSFTLNQASGDTIALDAGGSDGYHPDIFDWKWADHQLNDVQWLRADTFSWQSGAVYQAAYQHLADDIDGKTLQSETISGTTVQFYLADDGHKICPASEESNVAAIYAATGVAWYYIIDTVNTRFKLPRTQFGITGLRDTVGKYVGAGLPNITGFFDTGDRRTHIDHTSGAFYKATASSNQWASQSGIQGNTEGVGFDASLSNSIYGNSTTVQPKATEMYLYFYVGNFTQTAVENTAGLNAELFNGKADIDLSNTPMATADYVVEKQNPTSSNGYTWYRKYKSGWVEQGGRTGAVNGVDATTRVNLPIAMSDANYAAYVTISRDATGAYRDQFLVAYNRNATFFWVYSNWAGSGNASQNNYAQWLVCGIAA